MANKGRRPSSAPTAAVRAAPAGGASADVPVPKNPNVYVSDWATVYRKPSSIYFAFGQTTPSGRLISALILRTNRDVASGLAQTQAPFLEGIERLLPSLGENVAVGDPALLDEASSAARMLHDRFSVATPTYFGGESEISFFRFALAPLQQLTRYQPGQEVPAALLAEIAVPVVRVELPTALMYSVLSRWAAEVAGWR